MVILADVVYSWSELLGLFWPVGAVAFGITLGMTPLCRFIAMKNAIVDRPDDFLKPHGRPIPYLGGVAVFLGWGAGIAVAVLVEAINVRTGVMLGIALAGMTIMLVGLFDDLRCMAPKLKLVLNIAVAVWLLILGIGDELVGVLTMPVFGPAGIQDRWLELIYSVPVMLFIVVGACNATNLIDGMDGLCAGVLGIVCLGFLVLALNLRAYSNLPIENERIVLTLAMLGAAMGFLPFNRNPAKIFLGDAGSMLLGLNAAILILLFGETHLFRWMIGALMVFGLPIADMLLTLARRWRNGRPLMIGDRSHFYDQLRDRGLSVKRVVTISYLLTLAFAVVGASVIYLRTRYAILVYGLALVAALVAVWRFNMVSIEPNRPAGAGSACGSGHACESEPDAGGVR